MISKGGTQIHRGANHAKSMEVYPKSQEYVWSHITKTSLEDGMWDIET